MRPFSVAELPELRRGVGVSRVSCGRETCRVGKLAQSSGWKRRPRGPLRAVLRRPRLSTGHVWTTRVWAPASKRVTPVCPLSPPQRAVPVVAQYWARVPPSIEFFCSNLAHVLKYSDGNLISLSRVADYLLNSSDTIRCVMVPERKREKYRKDIARRKRRVAAGF